MRITTLPPLNAVQAGASATRTASGEAFRLPEDPSRAAKAQDTRASAAPMAAGLETLVALQAMEGEREKRRRSFRRGSGMLDLLDKMKLAMLSGQSDPSLVLNLVRMTGQIESSGDPGLDAVVAEIDLRAQVELAKIETARAKRA